eukprot:Awhi_evm1s15375
MYYFVSNSILLHSVFDENAGTYNCDSPTKILVKAINDDLRTRLPVVYRFLSTFKMNDEGNHFNDLLYEIEFGLNKSTTDNGGTLDFEYICNHIAEHQEQWSQSITKQDLYIIKEVSLTSIIAMGTLGGVFILFATFNLIFVVVKREEPVIKSASPAFLILICVGALITFCSSLISLIQVTKVTCIINTWLQTLGFFLALYALLFKTARVAILFNLKRLRKKSTAQRYTVDQLKDSKLLFKLVIINN